MLWTIFVILLIMWVLGLVTSYTMGGFVHILLVIALIVLVVNLVQGRRPFVAVSAFIRKEFYGYQIDNACWGSLSSFLGIVAFAYQGISYTSREKIIDVGPLQASVDTKKTIPLSPLLGGLVLVGGIVLVVVGTKKSS